MNNARHNIIRNKDGNGILWNNARHNIIWNKAGHGIIWNKTSYKTVMTGGRGYMGGVGILRGYCWGIVRV